MTWHTLGHVRATRIIRKLFGKGHLDWVWSRSISYGLTLLGLIKEGNYYRIEAMYREGYLYLILKNYYTGYPLQEYRMKWGHKPLPPLNRDKQHHKGLVLGVHTNPKNDGSYFGKWES